MSLYTRLQHITPTNSYSLLHCVCVYMYIYKHIITPNSTAYFSCIFYHVYMHNFFQNFPRISMPLRYMLNILQWHCLTPSFCFYCQYIDPEPHILSTKTDPDKTECRTKLYGSALLVGNCKEHKKMVHTFRGATLSETFCVGLCMEVNKKERYAVSLP